MALIDECLHALEEVNIPPARALAQYMAKMLEWNEKINVTGAKNPSELAVKHIADVWRAAQTQQRLADQIVDVGSGGGLPGLVLAVISPATEVTLVERTQKKVTVLRDLAKEIGVEDRVRILARSFEEVASRFSDEYEFWFRGVMPGPKLAMYLSERFPRGQLGQIVLMKGPAWQQEKLDIVSGKKIKEVWRQRFAASIEIPYELPAGAGERVLVFV